MHGATTASIKQKTERWSIEDVNDLIGRDLPSTNPVIDSGILPERSVAVVGGVSKLGKSLFAVNMGLCIATGTPFLLQFNVPKRRRVVYLQGEISLASLQDRLRKMKNGGPWPEQGWFWQITKKGLRLNLDRDLAALSETLGRVSPEVLILDPLYKFHSLDENKAGDMTRLFSNLDRLIVDHNLALVIVHHHGKPVDGRPEGSHQLRGSSAIADYGDTYLTLNRKSGKEPRSYLKLSFELRNDEDPDPLFLYRDPQSLWYEVLGEDSQGAVGIHDVVEALRNLGGRARRADLIRAVADRTGRSDKTAQRAIQKTHAVKKIVSQELKTQGRPVEYYLPGQGDFFPYEDKGH
ncbi:MAG: AAA family ATPase [Deltaproteobacteria bacterium]|nr:AAA family ATPase [Deltaproteobacteria bacterium]